MIVCVYLSYSNIQSLKLKVVNTFQSYCLLDLIDTQRGRNLIIPITSKMEVTTTLLLKIPKQFRENENLYDIMKQFSK